MYSHILHMQISYMDFHLIFWFNSHFQGIKHTLDRELEHWTAKQTKLENFYLACFEENHQGLEPVADSDLSSYVAKCQQQSFWNVRLMDFFKLSNNRFIENIDLERFSHPTKAQVETIVCKPKYLVVKYA